MVSSPHYGDDYQGFGSRKNIPKNRINDHPFWMGLCKTWLLDPGSGGLWPVATRASVTEKIIHRLWNHWDWPLGFWEKKTIHELKLDQKPTISSVVPYSPTNVPVRDSWWWPIASNKGTALRQEKDLPGPVVNPLGIPRIPNVDKPTMPGDGTHTIKTLTWGWFMTVNPTWNTMFWPRGIWAFRKTCSMLFCILFRFSQFWEYGKMGNRFDQWCSQSENGQVMKDLKLFLAGFF